MDTEKHWNDADLPGEFKFRYIRKDLRTGQSSSCKSSALSQRHAHLRLAKLNRNRPDIWQFTYEGEAEQT